MTDHQLYVFLLPCETGGVSGERKEAVAIGLLTTLSDKGGASGDHNLAPWAEATHWTLPRMSWRIHGLAISKHAHVWLPLQNF